MNVINKVTGEDVTSLFVKYMSKEITKEEFEQKAGVLKK